MERQIKLKAKDKHTIYGTLTTQTKPSDTLAIIVHGLTGHPNEHCFYNAAKQFPKKGVDVFRFSLYTWLPGGRKLSECTISTHSEDLNKVVQHFRKKYRRITVIGHSFGSPTILKSDTSKVDAVVLWDPSYLANRSEDLPRKAILDGKKVCLDEGGVDCVMNTEMVEEWKWFNSENELELIASLGKPLKIIAAKKGILVPGSRKYYQVAQEPKDLTIIPGATHCFDEEGTEEVLLSETLKWIKKHAK